MIWRHDDPPKDGNPFVADVGMPWACAAVFNGANGDFCCARLSVDLYLGDWCDSYFECEYYKTEDIRAWMPMPKTEEHKKS